MCKMHIEVSVPSKALCNLAKNPTGQNLLAQTSDILEYNLHVGQRITCLYAIAKIVTSGIVVERRDCEETLESSKEDHPK